MVLAAKKSKKIGPLAELAAKLERRDGPVRLTGLRGASRAVVAAELIRAHEDRPALIMAPSSKQSDALADDLRSVLGREQCAKRLRTFPRHDTLPYDRFSPQPFLVTARMEVLYRWWLDSASGAAADQPAPIVVTDWTALAVRVPARELLERHVQEVAVGQTLDRDAWLKGLERAGYQRMPLVEERGEFAARGGIVDFFSPHAAHPLRIELSGDEVDSIREFDAASQRSLSKLKKAVAVPAREVLVERDRVVECEAKIRELAETCGTEASETTSLIDALLRGDLPAGVEALAPLLVPAVEGVLDYLPDDALVILDDPDSGLDRLVRYDEEARASHRAATEAGRLVGPPEPLLTAPEEI
ncbi:MAG: hypothetical protein VCC04_16770, partial [Myxococcota bacterium]